MPFTPSTTLRSYSKGPVTSNPEALQLYYDGQLRDIALALKSLNDAVVEIRTYLKTLA